jgi:hypothetical protein
MKRAGVSVAVSPRDQSVRDQIVGTWRLCTYERLADGEITYPMGRAPSGYFTYDAHGRMSVQIMRTDRPKLTASSLAEAAALELRTTVAGYLAYCAAYHVDEAEGSVTHEVDVHLFPNALGSSLKRYVAIDGNRLVITIGQPNPTGRLTLERVEHHA